MGTVRRVCRNVKRWRNAALLRLLQQNLGHPLSFTPMR